MVPQYFLATGAFSIPGSLALIGTYMVLWHLRSSLVQKILYSHVMSLRNIIIIQRKIETDFTFIPY